MVSENITLMLIIAFSASAIGWLFFARRKLSGKPFVDYSPRRIVPWPGLGVFVAIMCWLFIRGAGVEIYNYFSGPTAIQQRLQASDPPADGDEEAESTSSPTLKITSNHILTDAFFSLIAVAVVCIFLEQGFGATWDDVGLRFDRAEHDIPLGIAAGAAIIPCLLLLQLALTQWIPSKHQIVELFEQQSDSKTMAIMFISAVVVAPLAEEFFIRAVLQGWLEKVSHGHQLAWRQAAALAQGSAVGESASETLPESAADSPESEADIEAERLQGWFAAAPVLLASGFFAAMHIGYGPDPIPIFLLSLALGYLYQRTHRLLPSITLHMLLNGTSLAILWASL